MLFYSGQYCTIWTFNESETFTHTNTQTLICTTTTPKHKHRLLCLAAPASVSVWWNHQLAHRCATWLISRGNSLAVSAGIPECISKRLRLGLQLLEGSCPVYDKVNMNICGVKTPLTSVFIPTDRTNCILIQLCMFQNS